MRNNLPLRQRLPPPWLPRLTSISTRKRLPRLTIRLKRPRPTALTTTIIKLDPIPAASRIRKRMTASRIIARLDLRLLRRPSTLFRHPCLRWPPRSALPLRRKRWIKTRWPQRRFLTEEEVVEAMDWIPDQMVDYFGTFFSSCLTIRRSAIRTTSPGKTEKRVFSRLQIQLDWPVCGAFKRTIRP